MIELLSPVGSFNCLKSAVQFGANAVYFGGDLFNARTFATNFKREELAEAIQYAKLRNVKVHFTLNTLIKNNEFAQAIDLVNFVYSLGADAIIVQDLGLAIFLINHFPDLPIHASTQMTIHNLDGVLQLQKLGFKRIVLARELSLEEIKNICVNSNIEIETFIHGALCISYSGQCLFSSSIGARSGNRGKCAQPCRLPYKLISQDNNYKENLLDKGYLLSPRDLCGLNYIPKLIKAGVKSLKIEGRMKSPTYVATVTKIYRKYIDLAYSQNHYVVDHNDITELMQAFNRGGFSDGNYSAEPNLNYVYKNKPNNMGLYLGKISNYNSQKGLVGFRTFQELQIGDKISIDKESNTYTISELLKNNKNIKHATKGNVIQIGRIKGNIHIGNNIYKLTNKSHEDQINEILNKEKVKIHLKGKIDILRNKPISLTVSFNNNIESTYVSNTIPVNAINSPITVERIKKQISKTNDTPFEFTEIKVNLDDNLYIPQISTINTLRRKCLEDIRNQIVKKFERQPQTINLDDFNNIKNNTNLKPQVSLLLNKIDISNNYNTLMNVDNVYIPIKYFMDPQYDQILKQLSCKFKLFIYLPTILRKKFSDNILKEIDMLIEKYNIKGIVISNIALIRPLKRIINNINNSTNNTCDFTIVGNIGLNVFNSYTISTLKKLGISRVTLSPEVDKKTLQTLTETSPIPTEFIVYGNLPLMNTGYCLLGSTNQCYSSCGAKCKSDSKLYLKDRLNMKFRVITDSSQTLTTIFNSKITSIDYSDIATQFIRISVIDENIETINNIIKHVKNNIPFSGNEYTKGNLDKFV